jgi:hypothetical protein
MSELDPAAATASWKCMRTIGSVWDVAIQAAIFNNHDNTMIGEGAIASSAAKELLKGGGAYQFASAAFVRQFPPTVQIPSVY